MHFLTGLVNPTEARPSSHRGPSPCCLLIRPSRAAPGGGDGEVEAASSQGKLLPLGDPHPPSPPPRQPAQRQRPGARPAGPALTLRSGSARAVALPGWDKAKPPSGPLWSRKDCSVVSKEGMGLGGLQALSLTPLAASPRCSWLHPSLLESSPSPPGPTRQRQQGPRGIPRPPPHQSGLAG